MNPNSTTTSSKPPETVEMECGSSLAEDVWAIIPSMANGAATTKQGATPASSLSSLSSSSPPSSAEEAWNKIHQLRSLLAADVIIDPPPANNDNNKYINNNQQQQQQQQQFPTFISPFQTPTTTNNNTSKQSLAHTGTPIPLIYCDHTASHRPLSSIETYLRTTSLPCHANTHTNVTYTGSQSTAFVSEARQIVGECTGARITGKASADSVLFCGNGVTGAVGVLLDCLNLRGAVNAAAATATTAATTMDKRPVVFVGPHEHHSNLLPWRESGCEVVAIPERPSDNGMVDLRELERLLRLPRYAPASNRLRMGAFSAASNVTGLIADVDGIAMILHRYGCLAFFDYASGAPYLKMDMNPPVVVAGAAGGVPVEDGRSMDIIEPKEGETLNPSKDAIYFSPHKCFGGTSTPGVLIIKKHLISQTNPPSISGGGTVFYVTNEDHRFLSNRIERYEGGTPDGIGIQRVGLAMLAGRRVAKEYERIAHSIINDDDDDVDKNNNNKSGGGDEGKSAAKKKGPPKTLLEYECSTYDRVVAELKNHAPNLIMLGTTTTSSASEEGDSSSPYNPTCIGRHLPIFSFLIRCGRRFLHYNYVCAILNDVFGIQSRGGCQCAGPYSQRLLGLTTFAASKSNGGSCASTTNERGFMEVPNNANRKIERALLRSDRPCELLRPGYTRLSLPFKGLREEEVDYVIQALIWVARNGWALLPQYRCDHRTGEWRHWSRLGKPLGKSERRWLSHFDILSPKQFHPANNSGESASSAGTGAASYDSVGVSRARLDVAMNNANTILEAAKRDHRFVSEVEKMNSANGMLGSSGGNDPGEGGVDDTLEDLRWYVYQQECAPHVRDGLDQVPETMDDDALLGGIGVRMDGKRGDNEMEGDVSTTYEVVDENPTVESFDREQMQSHSVPPVVPKSDLLAFQEEEHMGEAPFDEIKAGFEDGELSSECKIYHNGKDEWMPIEKFILDYEATTQDEDRSVNSRKRDLSAMTGLASNEEGNISNNDIQHMDCDESPSCEGINSININSASTETDAPPTAKQAYNHKLPAAVEKREKKKPSRDSSQWGQSSAPHIVPTASLAIGSSALENGGSKSQLETKPKASDLSTPNEAMDVSPVANTKSKKSMKNGGKIKPPPKIMRIITQAVIQWDMIQDGDRLLLGLSGGKDSLSLLHCLLEYQRKMPIKFEIEVCTIDPMTPSFDPSPLIPYVEGLGLKYHYIRDDIVARANTSGKDGKIVSSLCAFCARMKRGNLYNCARKNNCNKLVLAQHLDDCAESFFMSVMNNGFIRTMKANYQINAGDISVIRPLVYCRESLMTEFAKSANLPVINENCPACFEEPKERARVKKLLSREETLYPDLYQQIKRALIPVMHDDSESIMRSYLEETIAKSRKKPHVAKPSTGKSNGCSEVKTECLVATMDNNSNGTFSSLESATEEQLIVELARRRAAKYNNSGATKQTPDGSGGADQEDPTGQVCSLLGGNGTIPCTELMK